jgi:hypothetical protein
MVSFYSYRSLSASFTFAFIVVVGQNGLGAFVLKLPTRLASKLAGIAQPWRVAPV